MPPLPILPANQSSRDQIKCPSCREVFPILPAQTSSPTYTLSQHLDLCFPGTYHNLKLRGYGDLFVFLPEDQKGQKLGFCSLFLPQNLTQCLAHSRGSNICWRNQCLGSLGPGLPASHWGCKARRGPDLWQGATRLFCGTFSNDWFCCFSLFIGEVPAMEFQVLLSQQSPGDKMRKCHPVKLSQ